VAQIFEKGSQTILRDISHIWLVYVKFLELFQLWDVLSQQLKFFILNFLLQKTGYDQLLQIILKTWIRENALNITFVVKSVPDMEAPQFLQMLDSFPKALSIDNMRAEI